MSTASKEKMSAKFKKEHGIDSLTMPCATCGKELTANVVQIDSNGNMVLVSKPCACKHHRVLFTFCGDVARQVRTDFLNLALGID
jgi:hypothetical protein